MPEDASAVVAHMTQQATRLYSDGRYDLALELASQAAGLARQELGDAHPRYAEALNTLAVIHVEMGSFREAEPLLLSLLELDRAEFGPDHPNYAATLNNLASIYQEMARYKEAEPLLAQALDVYVASFGDADERSLTIMSNLAVLEKNLGQLDAALQLHARVLKARRQVLGASHRDVAVSLDHLADLLEQQGDYAQAEALFRQAEAIRREALGEEHPDYALSLRNLASLYVATAQYGLAEHMIAQDLQIKAAAFGTHSPQYAGSLVLLADLYRDTGRYPQAEEAYRDALARLEAAAGAMDLRYAAVVNKLAVVQEYRGQYAAAQRSYGQALEIQTALAGEDDEAVAVTLANLADLYRKIGDLDEAARLYGTVLQIHQRRPPQSFLSRAHVLNGVGVLLDDAGDYDRAAGFYVQALALQRQALGENHPDVARTLGNLAVLAREKKDYARAESLYLQVLEIQRDSPARSLSLANTYTNLAVLYDRTGNYPLARDYYQRALEIREQALGPSHPDTAHTRGSLAGLLAAMGQPQASLDLWQQVNAAGRQAIGQVFALGSERQRSLYLRTLARSTDEFLSLVLEHFHGDPAALRQALDLVLQRKGLSAEALSSLREPILRRRYPDRVGDLQEYNRRRLEIARLTLDGPGAGDPAAHQQRLDELNLQKEALERRLSQEIPEMDLARRLQSTDGAAVAAALPEGTALVEFVRFFPKNLRAVPARGDAQWAPPHYLAFVLPAGEPGRIRMHDLGEARRIEQAIAGFRGAIAGGDRSALGAEPAAAPPSGDGAELRRLLFDPLLPLLAGHTRLFLAPDGDLTRVPFAALPGPGGRYLIDDYHLSYVTTGRDLLRHGAARPSDPRPPLVVADPDYDLTGPSAPAAGDPAAFDGQSRDLERSGLAFRPLPGTRREGEKIAELLQVEPLMGDRALESTIKGHPSPGILHIATHGFFLPSLEVDREREGEREAAWAQAEGSSRGFLGAGAENPLLRSGLALAGANVRLRRGALPAEAEDGILNGEDVLGLDLLDNELTVLSACETALGDVLVGDGVHGLCRAFAIAGARTLVMSLWKVPDLHTRELMEDFYRRVLDGRPRADALREAQLAMKARAPALLNWGAFICQGDPGPLQGN